MKNLMSVFSLLADDSSVGDGFGVYEINNGVKIKFLSNKVEYTISTVAGEPKATIYSLIQGQPAVRSECTYTKGINKYTFVSKVEATNSLYEYKAILDTKRSTCRFELSLVTKQHKAIARNTVSGTVKLTRTYPK